MESYKAFLHPSEREALRRLVKNEEERYYTMQGSWSLLCKWGDVVKTFVENKSGSYVIWRFVLYTDTLGRNEGRQDVLFLLHMHISRKYLSQHCDEGGK